MKISVIGTGYVGLVTGACLADFGMNVVGVDKDESKIHALRSGIIPIYEPGLENLVKKNELEGRLSFSTDIPAAIQASSAVFIAVGTPQLPDGSTDLTFIRQVALSIAQNLNGYKVIVTKSTVPIGTGQLISSILREGAGRDGEFAIVSNPEFLREGSAIEDFQRPDRVVISTADPQALRIMLDIYSPLRNAGVPFVSTDVESAELIKYASNSFLATKISFINEMAELCEVLGADVEVVARGMGLDARIGNQFLHPGPGFGGSCFPKDSRAVASIARANGRRLRIVEAMLEVNDHTQRRMLSKLESAFGTLDGATAAVLGLSFKPDTDDIRESPAIAIVRALIRSGCRVRAYDPAAMDACRPLLPEVTFCANPYEAATGADGVVIVTEWNQFRKLQFDALRQVLRRPLMVDLRNLYKPQEVADAGLRYVSVGRDTAEPSGRYQPARGRAEGEEPAS
ncbi:MAG TPA: UDP-glucose/GDP-mannose dehydrogenase family protein [Thermoanaerobaculia bacterium]|nr:UDP-glucose/GDP-mannose dehydrogenase family protein [Thermoanaerobaculia bacterium]